jgi:glycerol-3-phosphate cytidylyltransferase
MKIGVIAGNFDVIHPGYIKMFNECKKQCTWLIVLLHEDPSLERPEKMKPILSVDERREMLLSLNMIDEVISYSTETILYEFIKGIDPDVRFLGDDYIGKDFTGKDLGIDIHYINRDHGWSTTKYKQLIADEVQRSSNI